MAAAAAEEAVGRLRKHKDYEAAFASWESERSALLGVLDLVAQGTPTITSGTGSTFGGSWGT